MHQANQIDCEEPSLGATGGGSFPTMTKRLYILISILIVSFITGIFVAANLPVSSGDSITPQHPIIMPTVEAVIADVNTYRVQHGLPALVEDSRLDASAMAHCQDEVNLDYYDHNRPDGTTPWHFFTEAGVVYHYAGENQGSGLYPNANNDASQGITDAWIASPEHLENIVKPEFVKTGVAICNTHDPAKFGTGPLIIQQFTD